MPKQNSTAEKSENIREWLKSPTACL